VEEVALEVLAEVVAREVLVEKAADGNRVHRDDPKVAVRRQDGDHQAEVRAEYRGDRDHREKAVQRQDGNHQAGVLVVLVVAPNLEAPVLGPREIEAKLGAVEPTGDIAPEKMLGGTTGDSGPLRAQLG